MREQVVVHKVGNRSGIAGQRRSAVAQKPKRRAGGDGEGIGARLRSLLNYFPSVLKVVLIIAIGVVGVASYRAAASATFFQVRAVEVQGTTRVSREQVQSVVRQQVEKSGVWKADLAAVTRSLERLPWVRTAVVSRVLPDRIRVRISEREPRLVARTASGRFRWVDEEAVMLGEMQPTDQIPPFFLRGFSEDTSDTTNADNRDRVAKFLELQREWDANGLSDRVSEVNLIDLRDVRAQLAGDSSQIEVRLGSQDQAKRLKDALEVLDAQRQTPRGALISYIDLSQGKRAIVGLASPQNAESEDTATSPASSVSQIDSRTTDSGAAKNTETRANDVRSKKDSDRAAGPEKKSDKPKDVARRPA